MATNIYSVTNGVDTVKVYGRSLSDGSDVFNVHVMDIEKPSRSKWKCDAPIDLEHAKNMAHSLLLALTFARDMDTDTIVVEE